VLSKGQERGHPFRGSVLPSPRTKMAISPHTDSVCRSPRGTEERHPVYLDLGFAIDALDHPVKVTEQRERQGGQPTRVGTAGFLEKASYTAALVAYMGCFGTGKRRPSRPGASSPAAWRIFWSATATTRTPATSTSPTRQTRPTSLVAPRGSGGCAPTSPVHDGSARSTRSGPPMLPRYPPRRISIQRHNM